MGNNPIAYMDPLGDTVKYARFGDRIRVTIGRIFNSRIRNDFKRRNNSKDVYVYKKRRNMTELRHGGTVSQFGTDAGFTSKLYGVEYSLKPIACLDCPKNTAYIRLFTHEFRIEDIDKLSRDDVNTGSRETSQTRNVGIIDNAYVNTLSRPDLIELEDENQNYIGGTQLVNGSPDHTVTTPGRSNQLDIRINSAVTFDGRPGYIRVQSAEGVRGTITINTTTLPRYNDTRTGQSELNVSEWHVRLEGYHRFWLPLFWPQKKAVTIIDKYEE